MSPGIWNNFYYSPEEIRNSFSKTDWKSKEVRSLFLDHVDNMSKEWVGEIQNPRLVGDVVKGDLVIVDRPTAIKLAYGAKMGISPKVTGQTEDGENVMHQFLYDNFSVVINPAVKTTWINNMDMAAFEKIRNEKGMSPDEFYAIPMDPPSASKLPIYDVAHVRNALARINQVSGVSEEVLKKALNKINAAAKKFNIKVNDKEKEENNMDSKEELDSVSMEEVDQDLNDYTDFVKQTRKEHPDWSFEEIAAEYKKTQTNVQAEEKVNKLLELADQLISLSDELKVIRDERNADEEEEKPEDANKKEEDKPEDAEKDKENVDDKDKEEKKPEDDKEEDMPKDDKEEKKPDEKPAEPVKPKVEPKVEETPEEKKKREDEEEKENAEKESLKKQNEKLMQKMKEMDKNNTQKMSQMSDQFNELKKKLDEPDKLSVKTVNMSKNNEPKIMEGSEDKCFLNALKDDLGGK